MAIARVSERDIQRVDNDTTTITISHDGGTSDCLIVFAGNEFTSGILSMTYGGVSLTQLVATTYAGSGAAQEDTIWGLLNPPTGVQNLVLTKNLLSNNRTVVGITTYSGVSSFETFPADTNTGQVLNPGPASLTVSVTTDFDDSILVGKALFVGSASDDINAGADTQEVSSYRRVGISDLVLESSPLLTGTAGTESLQVTCGSLNQNFMLSVVALSPAIPSPSKSPSASASPSASQSPSHSLSSSLSNSGSSSKSPSSSASTSVSPSVSPSLSPSSSISRSPSDSAGGTSTSNFLIMF